MSRNSRVAELMYNLRVINIGVRHTGVIFRNAARKSKHSYRHAEAVQVGLGYAQNVPELMRYFDSVVHRRRYG